MINRQNYGILFSTQLGPENQRFEVVQSQLKEAAERKRQALIEAEAKINRFSIELQAIDSETLTPSLERSLKDDAALQQQFAKLQKQEIAVKTKLAQIRFNISREKVKIEKDQEAFLAKLDQIYNQQAAVLQALKNLKLKLAATLLSEIDQIRAQALPARDVVREEADENYLRFDSVKKFNKQFMGFAQIDSHGKFNLLRDLNQDFSQLSLKDIQQILRNLLPQVNSTAWFTADSLIQLVNKLDALVEKEEYRSLLGAQAGQQPVYRNGGINFSWSDAAYELEGYCKSVLRQVGKLHYEQFQQVGIQQVNTDLTTVDQELQGFKNLNQSFKQTLAEKRRLARLFGDEEPADVSLAVPATVLEAESVELDAKFGGLKLGIAFKGSKVNDLKENAKQANYQLVNGSRVSDIAVDLAVLDLALASKFKKVNSRAANWIMLDDETLSSDPELCLHAAQSFSNMLKVEQALRVAYDNNLPTELADELTQAFSLQQAAARNMKELLNPSENRSGKNAQTLRRESAVLLSQLNLNLQGLKVKTENFQASELCRLIINTLTNNDYWNKQLAFSFINSGIGGAAPARGAHVKNVPTGIAEMVKLVNTYNFTYRAREGHWSNDPILVKQFLDEIKREADSRLNHKFWHFFSQPRSAHTSQFYKFISQLDENNLSRETFLAAKKLHSIENATAVERPELLRAPGISV